MQALLFDGQLRLANDYPEPILAPGEALIRPSLVGICNTDIEITRGYMGFRGVLGHEFVGVVAGLRGSRVGWPARRWRDQRRLSALRHLRARRREPLPRAHDAGD